VECALFAAVVRHLGTVSDMDGFEIGDGVTTVDGPMSGLYGTVVWFYEEKQQLLVRFGASQQMYYAAEELKRWGE
jgi:hypothetical protein